MYGKLAWFRGSVRLCLGLVLILGVVPIAQPQRSVQDRDFNDVRKGKTGKQPDEAGHVYFLLAVDTLDQHANSLGLDLDGKNMAEVIRWSMAQRGYQEGPQGKYTIRYLDGREFSEKLVLDYFRRLKVQPNDTLVFYFTGHGGFYFDKGHLLQLRNFRNQGGGVKAVPAVVDRSELLSAMARHKPRSIIVLTDCCSSTRLPIIAAGQRVPVPSPGQGIKYQADGNGDMLHDLFFKSKGVINITAARTGTPARGEREKGGSFFTIALAKLLKEKVELFDADKNGLVDWHEFFPALKKQTEVESLVRARTKTGQIVTLFHSPEAFLLGEARRQTRHAINEPRVENPVFAADAALATTDKVLTKSNGKFYTKEYPVQLKKKQAYLVSLHSSHFDCYLYLKDATGKIVQSNDDYGTTTTRSRMLFYPPEDGIYSVGVTSYGAGETGDFSLTVQQSSDVGELTSSLPKDRYCLGAYYQLHPIKLTAHRSYTIQLESNDFDTYLRIEDEFGNTIAMNDDEDEGQNRLNSVISFRTASTGIYYVVATSFQPGSTGKYAVFVQD